MATMNPSHLRALRDGEIIKIDRFDNGFGYAGSYRGMDLITVDSRELKMFQQYGLHVNELDFDPRTRQSIVIAKEYHFAMQKARQMQMVHYQGAYYVHGGYGMKVYPEPRMATVGLDWAEDTQEARRKEAQKKKEKQEQEQRELLEKKKKHDANIRKLYWARKHKK